jgi:hypothetical protein
MEEKGNLSASILVMHVQRASGRDKFPEYYAALAEKMDDRDSVGRIISEFCFNDGDDLLSKGEKEALEWTRKVLEAYEGKPFPMRDYAYLYLARKGDESYLETLGKSSDKSRVRLLEQRVAGTNVINSLGAPPGMIVLTGEDYRPVASVANTGMQFLYVEAILRQYLLAQKEYFHGDRGASFVRQSDFPAELQAMAVWFGEDGKPVCSVDLGKYGLAGHA